jgi:hypothetical protein
MPTGASLAQANFVYNMIKDSVPRFREHLELINRKETSCLIFPVCKQDPGRQYSRLYSV